MSSSAVVLDSSFIIGFHFTDAAIVTVARRNSPGFVATFDGDFHHLSGVVVVA